MKHSCLKITSYATRPFSRCYLLSYLVKNTAGVHKRTQQEIQELSSNTEEQELQVMPNTSIIILIKVLNMSKTTQAFMSSTEM